MVVTKNKKVFSDLEISLRVARVGQAYRQGLVYLNYPPLALWIELTNRCNLRCRMCPNSVLVKNESGFMEWGLYRRIIDEARGFARIVNLWLGGESLLHPGLFAMIRYAKENGLTTALNTNATILDEGKSKELIKNRLDVLTFSFDGYDKASHEEKRVGSDFEKTLTNIINFLKIKKEAGSSRPYTILANLVFSPGVSSAESKKYQELYEQFRFLPLDEINFRSAHTWGNVFARDNFFGIRPSESNFSPCSYLWSAMNILWDGRVVPCCNDFIAEYGLGRFPDKSLREIWNGRPMLNLRRAMVSKEYLTLKKSCGHCHVLWLERVLGLPCGLRGIISRVAAGMMGLRMEKGLKRLARVIKPSFGFEVKE